MENTTPLFSKEESSNFHLCFMLDDRTYALKAKNVLEVATLPLINEPQKLPEYIAGILNYNDLFINVIDIRKIFCIPQKKYELSNKIIIIKGEESLFAIIVDKVTDFFSATPQDIQHIMGESTGNIIKSFYKINDKIINIIEISGIEEIVKKAHNTENKTNYTNLFPQDEESICILQKRKNDIAKIPTMNLETTIYGKDQYVIFHIAEHSYCIYSHYVKELINTKNYSLTKLPYTPDFIPGIINIKGNFYSVLNLKKFIGYKPDNFNPDEGKLIVLDSSELKLALWVDDIVNIINIDKQSIVAKNDKRLDDLLIKAEAYIDNKVYNILNLDKLINDERLYIDNTN